MCTIEAFLNATNERFICGPANLWVAAYHFLSMHHEFPSGFAQARTIGRRSCRRGVYRFITKQTLVSSAKGLHCGQIAAVNVEAALIEYGAGWRFGKLAPHLKSRLDAVSLYENGCEKE